MSYRKKIFCLGLSVFLLSCGGCGERENLWRNPVPELEAPQHKIVLRWKYDLGLGNRHFFSRLQCAIDEQGIVMPDREGLIYALDQESGERLWCRERFSGAAYTTGSALLSSGVTLDGDRFWIGSEYGHLFCFNRADGAPLWQTQIDADLLSAPVVSEDLVLFCDNQYRLQAWDKETKTLRWSAVLSSQIARVNDLRGAPSPVVVSGKTILVATEGAQLLQFDLRSGERTAAAFDLTIPRLNEAPPVVHASPLLLGDKVYFIENEGNLFAFNVEPDGSATFSFTAPYGSSKNMASKGDTLYLVDGQDSLVALDRHTGALRWENAVLLNRVCTAPVCYQNLVIVGDASGYVYGFDQTSGELQLKAFTDGTGLLMSPVASGDDLIVHTRGGYTYCFMWQQ